MWLESSAWYVMDGMLSGKNGTVCGVADRGRGDSLAAIAGAAQGERARRSRFTCLRYVVGLNVYTYLYCGLTCGLLLHET